MESKLKNITVHYKQFGEGIPLVFLPAWGMSAKLLAHLMEPIFSHREGWQRLYIDPPGHGRTPGKDWTTNQDMMLEVIMQFMDRELPEERFVLAGMSSGAYLARGLLYHRANLIDGLLMLVPVIWAEESKRTLPPHIVVFEDPTLEPAELEMLSVLNVRSRKLLNKALALPHPAADEAGDQDFLERIRLTEENYAFSFDVDALPQPFSKPTLIITGRQDSSTGYHDSWELSEQYPRATYVVLDRAGHYLEEKEEINKVLIHEWLDRVEESIS
jgi:pimeloyl-ACP methyl ester carboxylesterase